MALVSDHCHQPEILKKMFQSYPEKPKTRKSYNCPCHAHELTFSTFLRHPFFFDPLIAEAFVQNLARIKDALNIEVIAYVVMPEHCHLLIWPRDEEYQIANILRHLKGPVAKKVLKDFPNIRNLCRVEVSGRNKEVHRFWQPGGGYDRNMWSDKAIYNSISYIHNNPVKRGLCETSEAWPWSSASNPIH
ncbi:hypothetical protein CCB80_05055 [Armatimonadetes bacterium Uphvl-Ar1]|nr:hypothetical protein CCB80_05055 [Armatimonadetes bacterium Uphvl-Ar1]